MDTVPLLTVSSIGANPKSGGAPLSVDFSATPSGGLPPYSYSWAFGDGGTSPDANPSHVYKAAGNYTTIVTVTDTEYVDQVITAKVGITVIWMPLSVTGTVSTTQGSLSLMCECTPSGGNLNYSYSWDFGDQSNISHEQNPTHRYSVAGTYSVTVTLRDTGGNKSDWSTTVTVPPATVPPSEPPKATALPSSFIAGAIILVIGALCILALFVVRLRMKSDGQGPMPPNNPAS
jgi:PKD repeat protein